MAQNRNARLITKRTSVPGKIPTGTTGNEGNFIQSGELASNLADHTLWGYDGTNVFEYGSNSFLNLTGGTITGDIFIVGDLNITGTTIVDNISATTISATTYYGDGSNLTGIVAAAAAAVVTSVKVNEAGGILKGQVIYINGATGGFPQVGLATNDDFAKADVIAIAIETGSNGQTIKVSTSGMLVGINTLAFTEGDILYLGTGGAITNIHPTGINAVQRIGHAVKINVAAGSMLIDLSPLSVINDHDGIVRFQLVNQNSGTSASVAYTLVNDVDHRSSLSMVGSNFNAIPGIAESLIIYNEGYNKTVNAVDGNFGFEWWTDETDSHNLSSTSKMALSASGDLNVFSGSIISQAFSGGTFYGDGSNLTGIQHTSVQGGANIVTGGTALAPIVSTVDSPSFNNLSFSGTATGGDIDANAISASTISGGTFYGDGSNLSGIVISDISYTIWAEENGPLANNTREWSFGNGSVGTNNIFAMYDATITKMFIQAETEGATATINLMVNDVSVGTGSFSANGIYTFASPIAVSAGDEVGFETNTVTGTWSDVRTGVAVVNTIEELKCLQT